MISLQPGLQPVGLFCLEYIKSKHYKNTSIYIGCSHASKEESSTVPKVMGHTSKTYCIKNAMIYKQNYVPDVPLTFVLFKLFTFKNSHILLVTMYIRIDEMRMPKAFVEKNYLLNTTV